ncbi:FTR1 family protein [Pseudanabaena sp. 'Roaring Creek']|uniref:FTR1 family iron permease n=1 Tax=Pseudanabaena sp. 'Roaring Creek' TaxID=1681830 RepID=UPI0006D7B444|nr:FTR1 family protein [Pseudanabaena sp. 'Roaring Creek']
MDFSSALPTFLIVLREGTEATLVVGIVLAYLSKANQSFLNKWVYLGALAGLFVSSVMGAIAQKLIGGFSGTIYYLCKGIFSLAAIVMLSWMLIWMTQQAKTLRFQVQASVEQALRSNEANKVGWGLFTLIFVAVLREGAETVLFVTGSFNPDPTQSGLAQYAPAMGCVFGIMAAIAIGLAIFRFGAKLNIRIFFQVLGIVLILIVAGLVMTSLAAFDLANTIDKVFNTATQSYEFLDPPQKVISWFSLGRQVTDTSSILPADKFPGIVLATLFGYSDKLYATQIVAYCVFLSTMIVFYFRSLAGKQIFPFLKAQR